MSLNVPKFKAIAPVGRPHGEILLMRDVSFPFLWPQFSLTSRDQTAEPILANVNSRSRLLYAIARPSVVCLSVVCL